MDPAFERAAQVWELVGWIAAAILLAVGGTALVSRLPAWRADGSARAAPPPARPAAPRIRPDSSPAVGSALPQQAAAPDVVALMVGGLADAWTYESVLGERTLRVEVEQAHIGEAFLRASLALRTPTGRQVWNRLGADRLELRSGEAAISIQVAGSVAP